MRKHLYGIGKAIGFIGVFLFVYNLGMAHIFVKDLPFPRAVNYLIVILFFLASFGVWFLGVYLMTRDPEKPFRIRKNSIPCPKETLEDVTYIQEIRHSKAGGLEQYDFLLASRAYGWEYMVGTAEYMIKADLKFIESISVSDMGSTLKQNPAVFAPYEISYKSIDQIKEAGREHGTLAVKGKSRTLADLPVMITWYNQLKVFQIRTHIKDEQIMRRYAETMIRRTFGTPDAMKLAKPLPKPEQP